MNNQDARGGADEKGLSEINKERRWHKMHHDDDEY